MDLSGGFNLSPSVQARLRLLDWIADNGGTGPRRYVDLGPLFTDQDQDGAETVAGHLEALEEDGFIRLQKTLGWSGWSCDVTPRGVDLMEDLQRRRGDLMGRQQAARDAFLRWLYDAKLRGNSSPDSGEFDRSDFNSYYGHTFTETEVDSASEWLLAEGYITGIEVFGPGVARPSITPKGQKVVERGTSVNADSPEASNVPPNITNMTITGSHNTVAANSPGAVQTVTVTMTEDNRRQVAAVADQLEGLVRLGALGLNEQQTAQAEAAVAELRQVADQPAVEPSAVRRALENAKEVAVSGTGSALGQGVVALVTQALQALGLG
ncbi:hypothetical protein [Geodermatophilus chilensis]|uniref:hypothetical protein n=1 Tax=Geodermatophilus chilensis TaxID=2035835 RepID=UPI000C25B7BA|nr:hypothetical protein [Geodermatophilus chilensis]